MTAAVQGLNLTKQHQVGQDRVSALEGVTLEVSPGEMMAIDKDAPSVQLIRSPEHKHTDGDVPELVPSAGLEAVARAYAKIIDEVNQLDIAQLTRPVLSSGR